MPIMVGLVLDKPGSRRNEVPAAASGFVETARGHDEKGDGTKRQNLSTSAPGIRPCPKFRWRFRASFFRAARFLDLSDLFGYDITVMVPNALRVSALEYRAEPTGEGSQN